MGCSFSDKWFKKHDVITQLSCTLFIGLQHNSVLNKYAPTTGGGVNHITNKYASKKGGTITMP